jgi:hypothetical protein
VSVLLRQPQSFEGLLLRAKVLPADDLALSEVKDAPGLDVRLYAASSSSDVDMPPGEDSLTEVGVLEMQLVLLEHLGRVGNKPLDPGRSTVSTLRSGPVRQPFDIGIELPQQAFEVAAGVLKASLARRRISMFSCDIAYSESLAASRDSSLVAYSRPRTILPSRSM